MKSEDLISRQAATEAASRGCYELRGVFMQVKEKLDELPPVDAVPVEWIEEEIKRLRDMDNDFAGLTANIIYTMLKRYRKEEANE